MISNPVPTVAGAWRAGDGAAVPLREATVAWALAAHAELSEIATGYGHFITVAELAERVQEASGVQTEAPTRTWMDAILRKIARRCHKAGEPPLTALCVQQNHTVGDTYKYVLELAGLPIPNDLELHAAYARWQCYLHHGAEMPADEGVPPLTPKVASRRSPSTAGQAEVKPQPTRAAVCAQCFIELPASGTCQYCV
ncbi:hypothetical protein [Nocardia sp. NBC_01009]|uniref:hypothetical protein n=1 Tax=Nocardia sp. NBC_01009 TaxID=2975996 RepID=UPI00386B126C|nr:hypothetical protein OHA42_38205 [Nocardia sp. NBC_01009]